MSAPTARPDGTFRLADGVVRGFAAELLLLPTGLVTAAVLTRVLGPEGYGLFSLAATFMAWLAWTSTAFLARAAVKIVSEADDWVPVASSVLRWRLALGAASTLLVLAAAGPTARALGAPELAQYLRAFAVDLLLFNLARAYREVLTGTGRFREVAIVTVVRWTARMVLIVALVVATGSVMGAVVGSVGATLAEVLMARHFQRLSLRGPRGVTPRGMWGVAAPLLVYGAAMQLYAKVDLFALSALGGTVSDAGLYGAAQNLAVAPGLFALAFAPPLLATLGRLGRNGGHEDARSLGRTALRVTLALVPVAALVAGASAEIVRVIFGPAFAGAAPLVALLFAAAVALAVTAVAVAIVTAAHHTGMVSLLGVGILAAAVAGHLLVIPRWGATGAATVTAVTGAVGALVALALVHRVWRVRVAGTALRAALVAAPAYWAAATLTTPSAWGVAAKLALLALAVAGAFVALGELTGAEVTRLRAALPGARPAPTRSG